MISHLADVPFFRDELAALHEGMQLVGSAGVVFGDYPVGWIRMIFTTGFGVPRIAKSIGGRNWL
jgi:hypothetical protein